MHVQQSSRDKFVQNHRTPKNIHVQGHKTLQHAQQAIQNIYLEPLLLMFIMHMTFQCSLPETIELLKIIPQTDTDNPTNQPTGQLSCPSFQHCMYRNNDVTILLQYIKAIF